MISKWKAFFISKRKGIQALYGKGKQREGSFNIKQAIISFERVKKSLIFELSYSEMRLSSHFYYFMVIILILNLVEGRDISGKDMMKCIT